jgi:16S rRNA (uracil1498-N3)-methyltransferase
MRKIRIYQEGNYKLGEIIPLSASGSQHVGKVLRMKVHDPLILFPGNNIEYLASIVEITKKEVFVIINECIEVNCESNLNIHLAQAITKSDKFEWIIQKAVELGVKSITPISTQHCSVSFDEQRLEKKYHQWQAIAISACEQSGRNIIPVINKCCTIHDLINKTKITNKFILSPHTKNTWRDYKDIFGDVLITIGPEGGFSELEVKQAQLNKFNPLSLGTRILRTETAAIAAISIFQAIYGDI